MVSTLLFGRCEWTVGMWVKSLPTIGQCDLKGRGTPVETAEARLLRRLVIDRRPDRIPFGTDLHALLAVALRRS